MSALCPFAPEKRILNCWFCNSVLFFTVHSTKLSVFQRVITALNVGIISDLTIERNRGETGHGLIRIITPEFSWND